MFYSEVLDLQKKFEKQDSFQLTTCLAAIDLLPVWINAVALEHTGALLSLKKYICITRDY